MDESTLAMIETLKASLKKEFYEFDDNDRLEYLYQAKKSAEEGEPCLITKYGYRTADSTQVNKTREYLGTWPASADLTED